MKKMKLITSLGFIVLLIAAVLPLSADEEGKAFVGIYPGDIWEYKDTGVKYGIKVFGVVNDSPAQEAGILEGDIIMEMDGSKLFNHDQFSKMLKLYKPGQKIKFKIYRNGDEQTIKLILADKADFEPEPEYKAYLGVFLSDLKEKEYEKRGLNTNYGVLISDVVEDGPCAEVGILGGDIMLDLDGQHVYTSDQISKMLDGMEPEQTVTVDVFRDGEYKTFNVVLGKKEVGKSQWFEQFGWKEPKNVYVWKYFDENGKWLGLQLDEISDEDSGVIIRKIYENSPAENSDLQVNDIIVKVDGKAVKGIDDIKEMIKEREVNDEVVFDIIRDGNSMSIISKIGKRAKGEGDQIQLSIDNGLMKMYLDGEEKKIIDLENIMQKIEKGLLKEGSKLEIKMDSLQKQIQDLNVDVLRIEDEGAI